MKKLKVLLFASLSLLLATVLGCQNQTPGDNPEEAKFTVNGYAKFDNAENHSGIIITLEQTDGLAGAKYATSRSIRSVENGYFKQTTTDSTGKYKFEDVPKGTYTVYASANDTVEKAAVLTNRSVDKDTTFADLGLTATGSISGKITIDSSTENVFGYEVLVLGTSYSASINKNGEFLITGVPAKTEAYDLCFVGESYRYIFQEKVSVSASKTTKLETKDISSEEWKEYKFEWIGAQDKAPENAVKNQAYFNKKDGCSYIFNGTEWELLVQAGSSEKYVSISATDRGIRFEARILSNITGSDSSSHNAIVTFTVEREGSDVKMVRNWSKNGTGWNVCEMFYPFVEAGKTYKFTFTATQGDYTLYRNNFEIEATGGLGDLKLSGDTDYDIELTDDRKIQFTKDVTAIKAENANILEIGTSYELYTTEWSWIYASEYWAGSSNQMYLDLKSERNWKKFDTIDNSLNGHDFRIIGEVRAKIAGYQDNGQTYFTIGHKDKVGPWDESKGKTKVYIVYRSYPNEYSGFISNLPGKEGICSFGNGNEKLFYDVVDYNSVIYEPSQVPTFTNLPDSKFNGWVSENNNKLTFPFNVNPSKKDFGDSGNLVIDGNKVDYYYCIFPDITPYARAKIMDGDQVFAEDVLIDLNNIDLTKENHVLEGIYTDAECTKAFGNENVKDILLHGTDNLCLYTKWIETKTLWSGDRDGSLNINEWADDIGSDSVFYIEVYNDSSYARETLYYMRDQNWNSNSRSDLVTIPARGTTLLKIAPSASDIAYMKQNGIYVDYNYNRMIIRSVRYIPTACVNVSVMDGTTVCASFVLNNLSAVNDINIPTKDNAALEGLYTDANCTIPFTQDSINEILASGEENACLYTKWNETKTLWFGDNNDDLSINDWADDIGSDSVFYIEVYNDYSYARETRYYMRGSYGSSTYSAYVTVPAGGTTLLKIAPSASDIAYMKQNGIYVSYNYNSMRIRSVRYTPTACVNVSVMDGDTVYTSFVLNNLYDVNDINIPTKDNAVLEGLYTDESCTIPFTQDSIDEILASGVESTCLYTKWNELKTLWFGDNYGSLSITDWADDIGSDSVFYIEVYNQDSYAKVTRYYTNCNGRYTYSDLVTVPAGGTTLLKIAPSASDIAYMKQFGINVSSDYDSSMNIRSVRYIPTACVNVSVMDGDTVYASFVLNNLSAVNDINIPTKDNAVLEGLYTDESCTIAFTQDSINEILASGVESTYLYTKWNEVVPGEWTLKSRGDYYFVQSGNTWTSNNQRISGTVATTTWTVTLENDVYVSIPWSVSSESNCDHLDITIDGINYGSYSGEDSGFIETTLTAGTHTLTATYSKDGSVDNGSDCATITLYSVGN